VDKEKKLETRARKLEKLYKKSKNGAGDGLKILRNDEFK